MSTPATPARTAYEAFVTHPREQVEGRAPIVAVPWDLLPSEERTAWGAVVTAVLEELDRVIDTAGEGAAAAVAAIVTADRAPEQQVDELAAWVAAITPPSPTLPPVPAADPPRVQRDPSAPFVPEP